MILECEPTAKGTNTFLLASKAGLTMTFFFLEVHPKPHTHSLLILRPTQRCISANKKQKLWMPEVFGAL